MNRSDLSKRVARELGCSTLQADQAVRAVVAGIVAGTAEDGSCTISNFGTFQVRRRRGRTVRSPFAAGQAAQIREGYRVGFRAGKGFREAVDGRPPDPVAESA